MIRGQRNVILGPSNVHRGQWNVNRVLCNVISGPWNVNRGLWNVNRVPGM